MHNRSLSEVLHDEKAILTNCPPLDRLTNCTIPEERAEHLWAIGCPFDTTVSEQGVGFRFIKKVAEVNIKILLICWDTMTSDYMHLYMCDYLSCAIYSQLCGCFPRSTCLCLTCETGFYLNGSISQSGSCESANGHDLSWVLLSWSW